MGMCKPSGGIKKFMVLMDETSKRLSIKLQIQE